MEMIIFLQVEARRVNQRSAIPGVVHYLTPSPGWGWIIGISRESPDHFFSKTEGHLFGQKNGNKIKNSKKGVPRRRHGGQSNVNLWRCNFSMTSVCKRGRCGCKNICVERTCLAQSERRNGGGNMFFCSPEKTSKSCKLDLARCPCLLDQASSRAFRDPGHPLSLRRHVRV